MDSFDAHKELETVLAMKAAAKELFDQEIKHKGTGGFDKTACATAIVGYQTSLQNEMRLRRYARKNGLLPK